MNIGQNFLSRLDKSYEKQKSLTNKLSSLVSDYIHHEPNKDLPSQNTVNAHDAFVFPSKKGSVGLKDAIQSYINIPNKDTETLKQVHSEGLNATDTQSPPIIEEPPFVSPFEEMDSQYKADETKFVEAGVITEENVSSKEISHRSPLYDQIDQDILADSIDDLVSAQETIDNIIIGNVENIEELKRELHSLKGILGTLGSKRGLELVHAIESALDKDGSEPFVKEAWLLVYQIVEALKKHGNLPLIPPLKSAGDWMYGDWAEKDKDKDISSKLDADKPIIHAEKESEKGQIAARTPVSVQIPKKKTIESNKTTGEDTRISLLSSSLEVWSEQVRIARQSQDATGLTVHSIIDKLDEMDEGLRRMGNMLRELEWHADVHLQARTRRHDKENFDPLEMDRFTRLQELTRQVSEGSDDLQEIRQDIMRNLILMDEWRAKENISLTELDKGMTETRLKPMESVRSRLERVVKLASDYTGDRVDFQLIDNGVEVDRTLLDKILTPLEHMLRNSIAHGIEKPAIRKKAGKTPEGHIRLECSQQAGHIVWILSDDGQGVNVERVREKAVDMGIISENEQITMKDAIELICKPSFSTNTTISELAGRGVGMDVVRNHVVSMGGRFLMESIPGKGTTTTIIVPSSSYSITSLVVNAGFRSYAVPNELVSDFWLIKREEVDTVLTKGKITRQGKEYNSKSIFGLLSIDGELSKKARNLYGVLVKDGDEELVMLVDRMIGLFDLTMSPLGDFWTTAPWIVGSVLLQDGSATFLINPLAMSGLKYDTTRRNKNSNETKAKVAKTILVVDDSLTVRKATSRILKLSGYNVLTAKDGKEGFEMFSSNDPDLVITDVEMPRMDGFELLRSIRQGVKTPDIPVIIITSRTAQRHRNHAETLKASAYLGKPYKDDELLEHIKGLLK